MTLLTLKMTPCGVKNISIKLAVPQETYFDTEILSLVLLEGILSQKYKTFTNLTLQYDLVDLEDDPVWC